MPDVPLDERRYIVREPDGDYLKRVETHYTSATCPVHFVWTKHRHLAAEFSYLELNDPHATTSLMHQLIHGFAGVTAIRIDEGAEDDDDADSPPRKFIHHPITAEDRRWAKEQTRLSDSRPHTEGWGERMRSIAGNDPSYTGHLGESAFRAEYRQCKFFHRARFDFLAPNGKLINVKTRTKTKEPIIYDCQVVPDKMVSVEPDLIFVLACLLNELSDCWLIGWLPSAIFVKRARKEKEGTRAHDGLEHECDAWNIDYRRLRDMSALEI